LYELTGERLNYGAAMVQEQVLKFAFRTSRYPWPNGVPAGTQRPDMKRRNG
jgi:hypothetical protein